MTTTTTPPEMLLSEHDVAELYTAWARKPGVTYADLIWAAERALLARLSEQQPVAWITGWKRSGPILEWATNVPVPKSAKLYAAPVPTPAQAVPAWQPISEAPQTGRPLLLGYWNKRGKWRTVRGEYFSAERIADEWEEPDDVEPGWFEVPENADDVTPCYRIEPSHFQPLPAAPTPTGAGDDQGGA